MATRVTGTGPLELKRLLADLHTADPKLRARLRREMKAAAEPVTDAVRRSALEMPAVKYQKGLRDEIASTISMRVSITRAGVRVTISALGTKMPAGKEHLVVHTDRARGWGHPVYADRSKPRDQWAWVRQWGTVGWFERPVIRENDRFKAAVQRAIAATARDLAR